MSETGTRKSASERSDELIGTPSEGKSDSREAPVFAVVSAVAEASGTDPFELPPLNEVIDPEALNDLFASRPEASVEKVAFRYAGYDVAVHGNGDVRVALAAES